MDPDLRDGVTNPTATAHGESRPRERQPLSTLERGTAVGRYLIVETLGTGGMGVVYAAYDPELDRKVAIKLVRADRAGDDHRLRVLREAQAMAKLSHRNVVGIYDVGTFDDQVFLAMELVSGTTLRSWLAEQKPGWREILQVMVGAGTGLAAAHDAGLVHRDVKPTNILVEDSGHARVMDFGIARAAIDALGVRADITLETGEGDCTSGDSTASHTGEVSASALSTPLTCDGVIVGTPAYMAPEQHRGESGPLTDQYSFCLTLYEALSGRRPRMRRRRRGVAHRPPTSKELASKHPVPAWVRTAVLRGLSEHPEDRFVSMQELLYQLQRDPYARWRRAMVVAAVIALAGLAVFLGVTRQARDSKMCQAARAQAAAVWNEHKQLQLQVAFVATGRPHAERSASRVVELINARVDGWVAMHTAACEATHVHGSQSGQLLDSRMQCLDRRLVELRALVDLLAAEVDGPLVDKAVAATFGLRDLADCADAERLAAVDPLPTDPAARARVKTARDRLERARVLASAGKMTDAAAIATESAEEGKALGYAGLQAEALYQLGETQLRSGDGSVAAQTFGLALRAAAEAHNDDLLAAAATKLVFVLGNLQRKPEEALRTAEFAEALVLRAGKRPHEYARLLVYRGIVYSRQQRNDEAAEYIQHALEVLEAEFGADHPDVAKALENLGLVERRRGNFEQARAYQERALSILERHLGPEHPDLALTRSNLGFVLAKLGRYSAARGYLEQAIRQWETTFGPNHRHVAMASNNLGEILIEQGKYVDALPFCRKALAVGEVVLPEGHPAHAYHLTCVGRALTGSGEADAALVPLERALEMYERAGESVDRASAADTQFALAEALWPRAATRKRALALAERAREGYQSAGQPSEDDRIAVEAWIKSR